MNQKNPMKSAFLTSVLTAASAYAITFGVMAGFGAAEANGRELPSSACHAATDDVGTALQNSGVMTYSGAGTKSIFCPMVSETGFQKSTATVRVFGNEGTDGASTKACACNVGPISCACSPSTIWVNNIGGVPGQVVANINTGAWAAGPAFNFGYILHTLTSNSSLAAMDMTF
jgi:hypothetical protein